MNINVFSLKEILFQGKGLMVNAKGIEGELTILPNHIPMITVLVFGDIKIIDKNNKFYLFKNIYLVARQIRFDRNSTSYYFKRDFIKQWNNNSIW